jgi:hypothetical protein
MKRLFSIICMFMAVLSVLAVGISVEQLILTNRLMFVVPAIGFSALAIFMFWFGYSIKCPRCKLNVMSQGYGGYGVGYKPTKDCPKCGRTRKGIWPCQYLVRPEPWDGIDHINYH